MLTTATVLMPLGPESMNVRQVLPGRVDTADISFARSFDENSAIAGSGQAQGDDCNLLKAPADLERDALMKGLDVPASASMGTKKSDVTSEGKMLSQLGGTKSFLSVTSDTKPAGTLAEGKTKLSAAEIPVDSNKLNKEISIGSNVELSDDQISLESNGSTTQQASPSHTDATDEVVASSSDAAALAPSNMLADSEKAVLPNQKTASIAAGNQDVTPAKNAVKDHNGVTKAEKSERAVKTEKVAVITGNMVASELQLGTAVSVILAGAGAQQDKISTPCEDDLSSSASKVVSQSFVLGGITSGNADKKASDIGKGEAGKVKTVVSNLSGDAASRTSETETTNTTSIARATVAAEPGTKLRDAVTTFAGTALIHAESGTSGVVPSGTIDHGVAASPHAREALSGAATPPSEMGGHAGSSTIDPGGQIDATHRTLMATPTSLEVGVANETYGWLKIRAEMTGGGVVNASLSTTSSSGQEMLHRELSSLSAYLQGERVAVNTVVVQPTVTTGADSGRLPGAMNGDRHGQPQQGGGQGRENPQNGANAVLNFAESDVPRNGVSRVGGDELPLASYAGGGSWLSVRA